MESETQQKSPPSTCISGWSNHDMVQSIEYRQLGRTDMFVSLLSLGGAHVGNDLVFSEDGNELISGYEEAIETIRTSIKSGINLIDTSPFYGCGRAELVLGKALEGIPRNSFYIATKVGRKADCTFDYTADWCKKSVELSLKKLGLQYIDVIHIHDCEYNEDVDHLINETLPALEELRNLKIVRYIGITGYPLKLLKEIIDKSKVKIDVVLSYCRCTPFDQSLNHYLPFFREKHIGVINAAILGMGLLTTRPLPYWHPATHEIKEACKAAANYCTDRGVNISKLSIYYALQQKGIDTHLIGMEDINALSANLNVLINGINDNEKQILNEMIERFFNKLSNSEWEGIEVQKYRTDPNGFSKFLRGERNE